MKKYINRFRIYDFGYRNLLAIKTRNCLVLCCILLGIVQLQAQPVCYDYNGSGSRVVRQNCPQPPVCQCPAGNPMLYQIGEEGESLSLSETDMYKQNTSGISGGCITVAGTLVIDANFSFSGVTMMMQPGAEIVINNSNFTLSLYGSTLKACSKLWSGINVGQSCTFNSWNSTIQDALYAVKLGHLSTGTISGTTFDKNHIGIFVDGSSSNVVINTSVTIKGNTFKCTGNLLPKWDNSSEVPKAAIEGVNAIFFVGIYGDPSSANTIQQTLCGILASQSAAYIYYVYISNIGGSSLNIDPGLTRYAAENVGIAAWESYVSVYNCNIDGPNRGINLEDNKGFYMSESTVKGFLAGILLNKQSGGSFYIYNKNEVQARLVALRLKNVSVSTYLVISCDDDDDDDAKRNKFYGKLKLPDIYGTVQGYVIDINNPEINNNIYAIRNKKIERNDIYYDTDFHGISLLNVDKYSISKNTFKLANSGGSLKNVASSGIHLSGSSSNKIVGNKLELNYNAANSSLASYEYNAIYANNSQSNSYCCNSTDKTKNGFYYLGLNTGSIMKNNEMKTHPNFGLFIYSGSTIGEQVNHWNKWTGTYSATGLKPAKNDNTNTTVLAASKFEVAENLGTEWFPNHIVPATGWFNSLLRSQEVGCQLTGDCDPTILAPVDGNFRTSTLSYVTNQFATAPYGAYTTWSGQRWVLKQIETNPDWLSNTTINTFNVNNQNSNIKKINDLDVQLAQLEKPNTVQQTSLHTIYTTMATNDTRLAQLGKLLSNHPNEADSLEYLTERGELLTDQAGMMGRMGKIQQEIRMARGAKLDQALALNASITAQNEFERNEKTINVIYLNTVARGDSMSAADKASVTRIASLCPMVGGTAVFKARFLYGYYAVPSFDDTKLCGGASTPPPAGKVTSNNTTSDVLMYPNPSSDEVYFSTSSTEPVQLILIDITGRVVAEQSFTSTTQISTRNLPNGQYFCQIWKGNQKVDTQKLSVIH